MSFQYINPYYLNKQYPQQYQQGQSIAPQNQNYNTVPYQRSFYNQNTVYPYSHIFNPNVNSKYITLGQIQAPTGDTIHLYKLANGQKVAIMPRKNEATIVKTFLDAGSINETDDIRGISHCIEHFLFNGSSKLNNGDVFKLTGLMGANTNASTDYAKVDYYITAPWMSEENLKKTIEIQGDMISAPNFDLDAIEAEKGPICSEISMMRDNPVSFALDKVIRNLYQIKSNSGNLVAGSIETVKNLSQNQIKNHYDSYYDPKDLYTVVIGDVEPEKVMDLISKNFTLKPKTNNKSKHHEELTPIKSPKREDIKSNRTNKSYILSAFCGPSPKDAKDFYAISMINYYLKQFSTSKLNSDLKEINGNSDFDIQKVGLRQDDPYAIVGLLELNPEDEQKGLDSLYDAIQKIQTEPINPEDFNALKKCVKKNYSVNMCNSEDICESIGINFIENSLSTYSNIFPILDSITPQDIIDAARKYYDLNKISIVAVHPASMSNEKINSQYASSRYSKTSKPKEVAVSFCGKHTTKTENVKQYKLQNNTHLALNNTNSEICVFNWTVDTPPVKPKNPNAPKVLEYIFKYGTDYKNKTEIARYKELNGISAETFVDGKSISISADCLPENINQTLALMNELMYHPKFTEIDFQFAKNALKNELELSDKDAKSNLLDRLFPGYFPTKGTMLKELDKLTLQDIEEFYEDLLKNASSKVIATIPYEKYPTLSQNVINYQSIPNITFKENVQKFSPVFHENPAKQIIIDTDNLNQAQIYKTYQFPMSGNVEDEAKFEIVNLILGGTANSRLFMDLREKQNLAYAVSSSIQSFENTGVLSMKILTTTDDKNENIQSYDNIRKSLEGFKKHSEKLCNELVSDEELEAAKIKLKQSVIGQCQNPYTETSLLSINISEPFGISRIDKYMQSIDNITKEDIKNAARYIFSYNPTISILASKDTINSQIDYLESEGEVLRA